MSERDGRQAPAIQRPSEEDTGAWEVYWKKHGQPWRREPEIDPVRQDLLKRCLVTKPELRKVMYPYQGMKLSRADVEWLLSTHESGGVRGPVDFSDERQRTREGLDIRGALLHEEDLSGLPLARIRGGLSPGAWSDDAKEQKEMAAVHLQKADLRGANLEEADLDGANLQKALLIRANLQGAILEGANLQKAFFWAANLQEADLTGSSLEEAFFEMANLQKAKLGGVNLQKGKLRNA